MADEIKKTTPVEPAPEPEVKAVKGLLYAGPKPAPLISNLPLDLKQPRLGTDARKFPADELPEMYIEYVRKTIPAAKNWWK